MVETVLVTGGVGYIGSHTCIELQQAGYQIVVLDNLFNSNLIALSRVKKITGKEIQFIEGDVRNEPLLDEIFTRYSVSSVIHFAGFKAVGESCQMPLEYYDNNIYGTMVLCKAMLRHQVKQLVFSSSATVYGTPKSLPLKESMPTQATNPYGNSKLIVEQILADIQAANHDFSVAILRYFNPIGAHPSGLIGENPNGMPNNLLPYVTQVAVGKLPFVRVFGDDYPTVDGTGVRDYIHVMDLAKAHVKALQYLSLKSGLCRVWNLGVGIGYSVLEVIVAAQRATGRSIAYRIAPRREGDIAECYADCHRAERELGWKALFSLDEMVEHSWNWQKKNPNGYEG